MPSRAKTVDKKAKQLKAKAKAEQKNLKNQIVKNLKLGKSKLTWLENQVKKAPSREELQAQWENSKEKYNKAKKQYNEYEKKVREYINENPKKALAMATAAVIVVGSVVTAFRKK
ncbi:MAG TPA: hypothetical protein VN963_01470 [bacterium]|nr:hypothetical protein [bacterium]